MGMAAVRPPPPPPPTRFEDLDADSILQILKRIPCKADRGRMFAVCRAWRTALSRVLKPDEPPRELLVSLMRAEKIPEFVVGLVLKNKADARKAFFNLMSPRALPWLLLPAPFCGGDGDSCRSAACVLSGGRVHHFLNIPPGARCFGSHDGGWLFLHLSASHHSNRLLRAGARQSSDLPAAASRVEAPRVIGHMYVHYLALSGRADDPDCFAAAVATCSWSGPGPRFVHLGTRRGVVVWRVGYEALEMLPEQNGLDDTIVDDVVRVRHKDEFHFLTRGGHVRVCKPILDGGRLALDGGWVLRRFVPVPALVGDAGDLHIRDRYLVVSRQELLMVVRFTPHPLQRETCGFKVFREIERKTADACPDFPVHEYPWSWSELDTLDGRMLFLGHGCSKSYEMDDYPGFEAAIYFLDDGNQYGNAPIFFRKGDATRYPCIDNGRWTQDGGVQRCFPRGDPSDQSAPVWLFP